MSSVQEVIDDYRYAILELSEQTQRSYLYILGRFASWCEAEQLQLQDLKPLHISKYIQYMRNSPHRYTGEQLSTHTLHKAARSIRTFLYWCAVEPQSLISVKIPENVVMPHMKEKIVEIFTPLEIKQLFAATEQGFTHSLRARDKAILAVLLDTGIRAGELVGLTLEHVHISPSEGHIRVTGKGNKEREVGLGKKSRLLLHSYIKSYRLGPVEEEHVFLSHKKTPMTVNGLDQMLYGLADKAGIEDVHAHKFRHTFAVNFLLQGGDVFVLSRLMGHDSGVQMTTKYLQAMKAQQARRHSKSVLDNL